MYPYFIQCPSIFSVKMTRANRHGLATCLCSIVVEELLVSLSSICGDYPHGMLFNVGCRSNLPVNKDTSVYCFFFLNQRASVPDFP